MTRRLIMAAAVLALCAGARADEWSQMIGQTDQVTRGLVAYYSMRNSGATTFDERGGNNATATNGASFSYDSGVVVDGARFDGVNDRINAAHAAALNTGNYLSISLWARFDSNGICVAKSSGNTSGGGWFCGRSTFTAGSLDFTVMNATFHQYYTGGTVLTTGSWHHVVATWDATQTGTNRIDIYVNGSKRALAHLGNLANGVTYSANTRLLTFGNYSDSNNLWLRGSIDEVRIFNVVLTPDEIRQLYRMGATPRRIKE